MASGWIAEFIESVTAPGTPIDDIKKANKKFKDMSVSYTHLTLPTILRV